MTFWNAFINTRTSLIFPINMGLNVIFANQWFELDHRWNTFATLNEKDPYIIHFIGRKPIYSSYENNESYATDFFSYLQLTAMGRL